MAALALLGSGGASAAAERLPVKVMILGDSLSAEYGLRRGSGWVALLETRLAATQKGASVVNASISGDTTAGGRARMAELLKRHLPTHVVIELGGNDALRGLPLKETRANLRALCEMCRQANAQVMVIGMQVPPNYGAAYGRDFQALFAEIAKQEGATLVPFLLTGIADGKDALQWFQADRIHPNEAAHPRILENVWPAFQRWITVAPTRPLRR